MGGSRAERSPRQGAARAGQTDQVETGQGKRKPDLKKMWPQVWELVKPRIGLLAGGLCLMVVNRVAGLVLPYTSKTLLRGFCINPRHCRILQAGILWIS